MIDSSPDKPLVSIIVPCYNQARFLTTAINSIRAQTYTNIEVIVVDDGSTDGTADVVKLFPEVKYKYQHNQGLSAARNTGIKVSTGNLLVFLDSDDWLLPEGIQQNVETFLSNPKMAFVSGGHRFYYEHNSKYRDVSKPVEVDNYCQLLECNFIAMIASVMFAKWVFSEFEFDTSLKACEDYDLYLKVARKYPIIQHGEIIAVYRIHSSNVSANHVSMLNIALLVLKRQHALLRGKKEVEWYQRGKVFWKGYYCNLMFQIILDSKGKKVNLPIFKSLFKYKKQLFVRALWVVLDNIQQTNVS